ncbi:MAG: hypothetical protein ACYTAO_09200 [Planctomycetota bacterium]
MYCLRKLRLRSILLIVLTLLVVMTGLSVTEAQRSNATDPTTPEGVRLLKNKSFDDSGRARKEILELYKDLRVTDVLDGMDLIGLQDIGLMKKDIRKILPQGRGLRHYCSTCSYGR